ncbi:helix-turn-helix transcriptional regulator [Panacagrimonas sp.]|uniref:helix-turn-helix transcriptional regulator n=1 Tax=Panacagrimonas sp. TaxID=2480088 RepID=UPI003B515BE6
MSNRIPVMTEELRSALIRRPEVEARTGLSRAAIYAAMSRGDFPRSISLVPGGRSVAWVASEVDRWVQGRIAAARSTPTASQA